MVKYELFGAIHRPDLGSNTSFATFIATYPLHNVTSF